MSRSNSGSRAALAAAALAVFGAGLPAYAANLLINPGFEAPPDPNGINSNVAGWTLVNDAQRANFSVANHTVGGTFGLWAKTFQSVGGGARQDVPIVAGQNYAFSSWVNIEAAFASIEDPVALRLQVSWLDSGGSSVGSPNTLDITPLSAPPVLTWTQYSLNATAPAGAASARVFVGWDGGGIATGAQSGFFDDVIFDGPGTPPPSQWVVNSGGNFNVGGNWSNGSAPTGVDAVANFLGAITSPATVYSDTPVTVGQITFNNANTYNLSGAGTLTLQVSTGNAAVNVQAGTHKLNIPTVLGSNTNADVTTGATLVVADPITLNGKTFTKTGNGTMVVEAPIRSSSPGLLRVSGGEVKLNFGINDAATASAAAAAQTSLSVEGSKATLNVDQALRGLDAVTANAGDQEVNLNGRRVRVYPANRATEETSIYNDIKAAILSASGRDGIYDSTALSSSFAVGVTDQAVDAHGDLSVLVRATRRGDANVDGSVNLDDFTSLAANFGLAGQWDNGDFTYDGNVNLDDFTALAANFGLSAADAPRSSVPEPTAMGLLAIAAGFVARRRR